MHLTMSPPNSFSKQFKNIPRKKTVWDFDFQWTAIITGIELLNTLREGQPKDHENSLNDKLATISNVTTWSCRTFTCITEKMINTPNTDYEWHIVKMSVGQTQKMIAWFPKHTTLSSINIICFPLMNVYL